MNKVAKRLLVFFIGIPLIFLIVLCDYLYHLPLQILFGIFAVLGANEFCDMCIKSKKTIFTKDIILIFVGLLPFSSYIFLLAGISLDVIPWFFICETIVLMGIESFSAKEFENSVQKLTNSILIIFYCGYFMTFLTRLTTLNNSKYIFILFLILVFMCDSCAWFFGMLFGKNNRGFVAASPNKSLIGFAGGILGSITFGAIWKFFLPEVFTCSYTNLIILSLVTSIASIVGDLIESVFKRSCNVKDSGVLIPGRGGILDSIDSILIAAPVFYIGQYFLLK